MELRQDLTSPQGEEHHGELYYLWWRGRLLLPAGRFKVQDKNVLKVLLSRLFLVAVDVVGRSIQFLIPCKAKLCSKCYSFLHFTVRIIVIGRRWSAFARRRGWIPRGAAQGCSRKSLTHFVTSSPLKQRASHRANSDDLVCF